jgi:predicted small lipoprotein YifL
MKTFVLLTLLIITLAACGSNGNIKLRGENATILNPDSGATKSIDTLCFERYSGLQKQDTASISIIINGNDVTGRYANYPYEKDSRVGTVVGIKSGNFIKGTWRFQQEGMNDTIGFEFELEGNSLRQKQTSYDANSGREVIADTATFNLEFIKRDCKQIKLPYR